MILVARCWFKAIAAVNRLTAIRLEWHFGLNTAATAHSREELFGATIVATATTETTTATTGVLFGSLAAWFATLGLGKATLSKKFLVAGAKHEFYLAIATHQIFIFEHWGFFLALVWVDMVALARETL